jgi:uncharacterized membrane protein
MRNALPRSDLLFRSSSRGIGHFVDTESMAQMLAAWTPARFILVYLTGVLEFAIAVGFLTDKSRRFHGMGCRRNARIVFSSKRLPALVC